VVILANPRAGSSSSREQVEELATALRARKLRPTVCWRREEFSDLVGRLGRDELRCVVAAGGDGTLIEAVNRAPGLPVATLPVGTENLVARYWGIERSGRGVAQLIAAGRVRRFDLGRVESAGGPGRARCFCLVAGAGFDAEVVYRVHSRRHGHIDRWTYVWPFVQALRRYRYPPVNVEVLDTGERFRGAMVLLLNLPRYGGGIPVAPEAEGDDGLLNLVVFERAGLVNLFRYFRAIFGGWRDRLRDCHVRLVRRVRLEAAAPVRLQTDGDPAGTTPVTVEVVPGAMTLVVPG
jgi:diacylglycerol kinase (ATP)